MAELVEHSIVAGKYQLVRQLGRGGMGSVWLAEHLTLRSRVAIKLIHVEIADNAEVLSRFLREAQSAASLRSPHVVQILDHGVDNGTPYIAMELLDGESLADRLARVGRLEPAEVARIMTQIGRAIGRAHEAGIVHRDLKPDNVFLVQNDDEEIAKVLDFGIAKTTAPGSLGAAASSGTRTGSVLGTPYYMSPEQAEGAKTVDHRTDIWAMGVIAFEYLVGRRPFDAETLGGLLLAICARPIAIPSQCGPVPAAFDAWFARACNRELSQRFATARDAALALKQVCEGGTVSTGTQAIGSVEASGARSVTPALLHQSGAPIPVQSIAAFSASNLESSAPPKKPKSRVLLTAGGLLALALGGALTGWLHFESQAAPAAATASAPVTLPAVATQTPAPSGAPAPVVTASASAPALQATESAPVHPTAAATARPKAAAGGHAPAKHNVPLAAPTPARAAERPAREAAPAPPEPAKPAAPAAVNLGI